MSKEKERLDNFLVKYQNIESREKAKAIIMAGMVYVDGQKCDKPGTACKPTSDVEIRGKINPYVSRGGLKLEKALKRFPIDLSNKICIDIGASTGGFTDCMLQNGAKKVYSVDVGYGQLDWKLRNDDRVVNLERKNIRYLQKKDVPDKIEFFSMDVSFISIKLCIPNIKNFISPDNCEAVCLIKPQFEAGRELVGKNGVIRDSKVHIEVIKDILSFLQDEGFSIKGLEFSPVKGPKGNIEYLAYIKNNDDVQYITDEFIAEVVAQSHRELNSTK